MSKIEFYIRYNIECQRGDDGIIYTELIKHFEISSMKFSCHEGLIPGIKLLHTFSKEFWFFGDH